MFTRNLPLEIVTNVIYNFSQDAIFSCGYVRLGVFVRNASHGLDEADSCACALACSQHCGATTPATAQLRARGGAVRTIMGAGGDGEHRVHERELSRHMASARHRLPHGHGRCPAPTLLASVLRQLLPPSIKAEG
jgi:hypothetical protein